MAHIQTAHLKLWKPQDLAIDKISSQMMFVDNIDALEAFALSVLKKSHAPVASITELKAIDASDTTLYTNGMTIMVRSSGLYFFDRGNSTADNGKTIIAPTTGGGRWISDQTFLGSLAFKDSLSKTDVGLGNVPNVATNDQTPTYTQSGSLINLVSGEKLSVSMGKIMKAIADLIAHLANKTNPHEVTKTQVGLGSVPNVATNDQTPTYTAATTLGTLTSGEKLSVSMGKIMKAITDLISHITNKTNPHGVTAAQVGLDNINNLNGILSINKGGTGGSSRAESINNLFASGADILDANTVLDNGTYVAVPDMTANIPVNKYGLLITFKNIAYYYIQIFSPINTVDIWIRTKVTTSTWSSWKKIASTDVLPASVE